MTTVQEETRICRICSEEKSLDLFEIDIRNTGGITSRCKACKASLNDRAGTLLSNLKKRAKEDGTTADVTLTQLKALFAAFDGRCVYCGITEDERGVGHDVDHVIPTSRGGSHHISNLVLACRPCNRSKSDKPFTTFYIKADRGKFTESNFQLVEGYLSLMSSIPLKEYREQIIQEHANYVTEKLLEDLDKRSAELEERKEDVIHEKQTTEKKANAKEKTSE